MLALGGIRDRYLAREIAHAGEVVRALGNADGAARVEQVESVRATQHVVVRRYHQPVCQSVLRLGLEQVVHLPEAPHVGDLEIVDAVLDLRPPQQVTVGAPSIPVDLPHLTHALEIHDDALQAIGDLDADRVQREAACLLEVGDTA